MQDHIITVNDALRDYYREMFDGEVSVVMNCPEEILAEYEPPAGEMFTILYVGTLHKSRYVSELVDVVGSMDDVQLKIGGEAGLYDEIEKRSQQFDHVSFLGTIPYKAVMPLTKESHAIFCMFDPENRINQVGTLEYDEDSLRNAIGKLRDDHKLSEELGKNGLKAAQSKYNWKVQEKELLGAYSKMGGSS
jgi:glycosyltransferase involved in cell wall biosynthesis